MNPEVILGYQKSARKVIMLNLFPRAVWLLTYKNIVEYCSLNSVVLQPSKCYFIVINETENDKLLSIFQTTNT